MFLASGRPFPKQCNFYFGMNKINKIVRETEIKIREISVKNENIIFI
jgi:hypothetical protein